MLLLFFRRKDDVLLAFLLGDSINMRILWKFTVDGDA